MSACRRAVLLRLAFAALAGLGAAAGISGPADTSVRAASRALNGGFEETVVFAESHPYAQFMRANGWTVEPVILTPRFWTPSPIGRKGGEFRVVRDKAAAHSGETCVFLKGGDLAEEEHLSVKAGDKVTIQFWARAASTAQVAGVFYVYGQDAAGKPALGRDAFQRTESVGANWTKLSHTFAVPAQLDGATVTTVVPVLRALAGAFLDDAEVFLNATPPTDVTIRHPDAAPTELAALNGGFEDWQALPATPGGRERPQGWDLNDRSFPCRWLTEERPGERGSVRRISHEGADRQRFGDCGLLLNGRLVSDYLLESPFNRELQVSFWARGEGGHVDLRVRLYGFPPTNLNNVSQLGRVIDAQTDGQWQQYTGTMLAYGNSVYGARLELLGAGVIVDDLRMVVSDKAAAKAEDAFQPVLTVPVAKTAPDLSAGFAPAQWREGLELRRGFMNMQTGHSVLRQTDLRLASDGRKLFLCATCPVEGEPKADVRQRDGPVWSDDSLEVYLNPTYDRDPKKSPARVYQFVVNANGAVYDHFVEVAIGQPPQPSWNCPGLDVKSDVAGGVWTLMLAVPLAEVGLVPGQPFGLNVCRTFQRPAEYTSLTGGAYQNYRRMVACTLAPDAPAVAWGPTGDLATGRLGAAATISNPTATPRTWQVSLNVGAESQAEATPPQTVALAPGASQVVSLEAERTPREQGRVSLSVATPEGQALLSQLLPFDRQEVTATTEAVAAAATPQRWRLEYYPVQGKVNIRLLALANRRDWQAGKRFGNTQLAIYRGDALVLQKTLGPPLIVNDEGHVTVPFAPKEDGEYLVRALVCDAQGDGMEFVSGTIRKQPLPWLGNALGKDPVVLPPFTPMKAAGQTISCLGRDFTLAGTGLPSGITAHGAAALGAPARFVLEDATGKQAAPTGQVTFTERAPDHVTFTSQGALGGLGVKLQGRAEYDGMIRYEVEFAPKARLTVKSLTLELPVNDVRYLHAVSGMRTQMTIYAMAEPKPGEYRDAHVPLWSPEQVYQQSSNPFTLYLPSRDGVIWSSHGVTTAGIVGDFMPYVWIGNARTGVCWFADSDRGWEHDGSAPCLELVRAGSQTTLRVRFIGKPTTLTQPRKFVFGLMATPVKPRRNDVATMPSPIMGFGMQFLQRWSSLRFSDSVLAQKLKQRWNQTGVSSLIYIANDLMNAADPAMASLADEWARTPGSADNHIGLYPMKLYGPNPQDYDSRLVCAEQSRVDYQVWCLDRAMEQGAIDGVYMDNSSPAACTNLQHANCGTLRDDGTVQGSYHIFETRDLIKRTAVLAHQRRCHWPYWAIHMTSAMVIPCFSFADLCVEGEWGHEGKDAMDFFTLPYLEVFGAGAWGVNQGWLPKLHGLEGETKPTRTLLAALKLYDQWIWRSYCNVALVEKFAQLERKFGVAQPDCRFVGYWEPEAASVAGLPPGLKASFYVRPGKGALVYVANFKAEPQTPTLKLDFRAWKLSNVRALDAETDQELALSGAGECALPVAGHDFRVIRLEAR